MSEAEANRFNQVSEPYLYRAAVALLGPARERFLNDYKFYITPATDDRPYFFRSFKWALLPELLAQRAQGGLKPALHLLSPRRRSGRKAPSALPRRAGDLMVITVPDAPIPSKPGCR